MEKAGGRLKGRAARGDIPVKNEERSSETIISDDLLPNPNKSIHPIYFPSKYHPCKQQSVQSVKMGRLKFV
ncbi:MULTISPECIES: hypothetical protein [unclassified Neisseria]